MHQMPNNTALQNLTLRQKASILVRHPWFNKTIITLIVINAITLGIETSHNIMEEVGTSLRMVDRFILTVFVIEILLRIYAEGWRFFKNPWNIFDFFVVGVALLPAYEIFSIFRTLRILRALRIVSTIPSMRRVVAGLLRALPGISSIIVLMLLIFYVAAVMATKLFGEGSPEKFGTLGETMYTLFQVMTLEGWSEDVVRPLMEIYPYAWLYFVVFILVTSFALLNLFIGVIVNAMQHGQMGQLLESQEEQTDLEEKVLREVREIRKEIQDLKKNL